MGLVEFGAGWALGAKAGETRFDEVVDAGRAVLQSPETGDFVQALRAHVGYSLKALGAVVMGDETEPSDELLDIVRHLVQRKEGSDPAAGPPPLQIVRDIFRGDKRGTA
jgi:hypothetical protein